ncbi:MAG: RNA polymerase sigma factor [Phycisphaerales bacterium]|nr:RNA polymerase sigma factor [Phycisphaerales bacterium]
MNARQRIEEELLVLRCQEGDPAAMEQLVLRWQERLWHHARRLSGNDEAAWDVLQEAWMAMAGRMRSLNDPAAFGGWAYQIVSHKCRDWIRREMRGRAALEAYREMPEEGEDEWLQKKYEEVKALMERLSGAERAILALVYEEGFDMGQVAEILGVPAGTVKSRLFHARRKLRELYEERHHDTGK